MRTLSRVVLPSLLPVVLAGCLHRGGSAAAPKPAPEPARPTYGRSLTTIDSTDLMEQPDLSIGQILATRVPGVRVLRDSNGDLRLRVRGEGTFLGDGQPLIIVDGAEINVGRAGSLLMINPHDIASIQVVRDMPQLALYGVRGSNGVIVITTKRPHP